MPFATSSQGSALREEIATFLANDVKDPRILGLVTVTAVDMRARLGLPKREEGEMKYFAELPPDYAGGLEKEGSKALKDFVEAGGTLVAFASSSDYVLDEFNVPARNILARTRPDDFSCPGSIPIASAPAAANSRSRWSRPA